MLRAILDLVPIESTEALSGGVHVEFHIFLVSVYSLFFKGTSKLTWMNSL